MDVISYKAERDYFSEFTECVHVCLKVPNSVNNHRGKRTVDYFLGDPSLNFVNQMHCYPSYEYGSYLVTLTSIAISILSLHLLLGRFSYIQAVSLVSPLERCLRSECRFEMIYFNK